MEGADGPSPGSNNPSRNDDTAVAKGDQFIDKLLSHIKTFLPFLTKMINNSEMLDISPARLSKLQSLYELVDSRRMSLDKLKACKKVLYDLYDNFSGPLNYYLQPDFRTSWMKEILLHEEAKKISSEIGLESNKCNPNPSSKSEVSIKIAVSSACNDEIVINQPQCQDSCTLSNENYSGKSVENATIGKTSLSINSNNDCTLPKNDFQDKSFSDSCLTLNKAISFVANASIKKLNTSDLSATHSDLTTQIFDDIVKQKSGTISYQEILKGININDIDLNHVKEVLEGIKKDNCVDTVHPPPLPLLNSMDLATSRVNLISTTEPYANKVTHDHVLSTKSTTIIHKSLNTEIKKLSLASSFNKCNQKYVSVLKPGTLIDLEHSKVSQASLHMEPLRPINKSNEENTNIITSNIYKSVTRDPRIRRKSILSPENSINQTHTPSSLTSNAQNNSSSIPTIIAPSMDYLNTTIFETRVQEMAGFNVQKISSHTNIRMFNPKFSLEHNDNSNQMINNRLSIQNQNRHNRNDHQKNEFSQFSNSTKMHVQLSHRESKTKYYDPVPYKPNSNTVSMKHPRLIKNVSKTSVPQFQNYKQYRQAKYDKGFDKNQNKINKVNNQYRSSVYENNEKKNTKNSSFNTFRNVNETANIKSFKIPKIKHSEVIIDNNTVVKDTKHNAFEDNKKHSDALKTENSSKMHFKTDIVNKQHKVAHDQKTEINKGNSDSKKDIKQTYKINDIRTEKYLETIKSSTDTDLKMYTTMDTNSGRDETPEINLREISVKRKFNQDELDSKSEQRSSLQEPTTLSKSKKPKKYSKEKVFEKIVKEAVMVANADVQGPKTRTRSSLLKIDETLETLKVNSPMRKIEKNITIKNDVKLESRESSNKVINLSNLNIEDRNGPVETGLSILSSTPKEPSRIDNSTTTEMLCISKEKIVGSINEINSTPETSSTPKIHDKMFELIQNPQFINMLSVFQDDEKLDKLHKLFEISNTITNDDKLQNNDLYDQLDIDKQKKISKKMKKENKKRRKMKRFLSGESSNENIQNEHLNSISGDNDLNQAENTVKTTKKISHLNDFKDEKNTHSGNMYDISPNQHKFKLRKCKKSKESYGNFEILRDKCDTELKDLKIVIKNTKRRQNSYSDLSSTSHGIKITNMPNEEKTKKVRHKKPFIGPLSVKLARQKMETKRENSQIELDNTNQVEFESKTNSNSDKNKKSISKYLTSPLIMEVQPIVLENVNEPNSDKSVVQKPKTSAVTEPNFVNIKKKSRLSELDKLHAGISGMYDCAALFNSTKVRQCRNNKKVDYLYKNLVTSKNKKESNIEQLDSKDNQCDELICCLEKPKTTKKKVKKSTFVLNKKKHLGKKPKKNETLVPITDNTVLMNKMPNTKKKKEKNKMSNQSKVSFDKVVLQQDTFQLNNVSENKISTEISPQVVTENKSYFKTAADKDQHAGEEVLPSRLSKGHTELLIDLTSSSSCQDLVKNTPTIEKPLFRIRCRDLSGDRFSTHKPGNSNNVENCYSSVNISPSDGTNSNKKNGSTTDLISTSLKSDGIDEISQLSDTVIITIPDNDIIIISDDDDDASKLIMLDDTNRNDTKPIQETMKMNRIRSVSVNKEKESQESSNDSIIIISDDDDVSVTKRLNKEVTSKQKCLGREESNKTIRLVFPIIELDKLYVCKECNEVFSDGQMYKAHLNVCPFWDNARGKKCVHCDKVLKTPLTMTKHIKLHGPDRFKCHLCHLNVPSECAIKYHMKRSHNILNLDFVPEHPNLSNLDKDNFIVFEEKTVKQKLKFNCNSPFKSNNQKMLISHMKIHSEEQPNNTINSGNVLFPQINEVQQKTSLKRKHSNITEEELHNQSKHLMVMSNVLEKQAFESTEPTLFPLTCRGIPIEPTLLNTGKISHGVSKSPESVTKSSSIKPHKQKPLLDFFNKDSNLGVISSNGHFVCPKCNVFTTMNILEFRKHLYKEINSNMWFCLKCLEVSDSSEKMVLHVKKHGTNFKKIVLAKRCRWIDQVLEHQQLLLTELHKNSRAIYVKSVESSKNIIVYNKKTSSPTTKKNIDGEKKVSVSQPTSNPIVSNGIIDLVDDSDDE